MAFASVLLVVCCAVGSLALHAPGAVTVGAKGHWYANLSSALADTLEYFIYAGTYTDSAVMTRANVRVYGPTLLPLTYLGNTVTITNDIPASVAGSNDKSGTVQVHAAANVSLYNLNIANTYGKLALGLGAQVPQVRWARDADAIVSVGTSCVRRKPVVQVGPQAIALSVQAGLFGGCGLKITEDENRLLANVGTWIEGAVDLTIRDGNITAAGRGSDDAFWYVIDRSVVQGNGTESHLGRPWGNYARVVYQYCSLGKGVPGLHGTMRLSSVALDAYTRTGLPFWQYRPRYVRRVWQHRARCVRHARQLQHAPLSAPVSIETVLSTTDWVYPLFL
ncbi:hypothetical protein C8Q80DRAFT_1264766 [Daedaleopsis nitida]|nr:hypothetical protein C8Q80DRAFT_1264766 [Daedaleopsis nitida]